MAFDPGVERWPPTYDAQQLADQIRDLAGSERIARGFYEGPSTGSRRVEPPQFCQGDIVALDSAIPIIGPAGSPMTVESDSVWMVIGNTCDLVRDVADAAYTQLVPAVKLGTDESLDSRQLVALRNYSQFRRFYLPPWPGSTSHFVADFLQPVALHKDALAQVERLARMSVRSWVLLHSCLVRFLARDDGRHD